MNILSESGAFFKDSGDWKKNNSKYIEDPDDEQTETPEDVVLVLGFDPAEEDEGMDCLDKDEFKESEHPRDKSGKFTAGGGESGDKPEKKAPSMQTEGTKSASLMADRTGGEEKRYTSGKLKGYASVNVADARGKDLSAEVDASKKVAEVIKNAGLGDYYDQRAAYMRAGFEVNKKSKVKTGVVAVFDSGGFPAASAKYYPESNGKPPAMRVDTLGSVRSGGGVAVLMQVIEESKRAGFDGRITLTPIRDTRTIGFYISMGLDAHPNGSGDFHLSGKDAEKLLEKYKTRYTGDAGMDGEEDARVELSYAEEKELMEASGELFMSVISKKPEEDETVED